jgi:hypothetical protein
MAVAAAGMNRSGLCRNVVDQSGPAVPRRLANRAKTWARPMSARSACLPGSSAPIRAWSSRSTAPIDRFLASAAQALAGVAPQVMLTGAIAAAYAKGIATLTAAKACRSWPPA